jgi:hypothetical protein
MSVQAMPVQAMPVLTQTIKSNDKCTADVVISFTDRVPTFEIKCNIIPLDLPAWMELIRKAAAGQELTDAMKKGNRDTRVNVLKICHMFGYDLPNVEWNELKEARDWAVANGFSLAHTLVVKFKLASARCTIALKKWNDGRMFITSIAMAGADHQAVKYFNDCIYWTQNIDDIDAKAVGPNTTNFAEVAIFADSACAWKQLKLSVPQVGSEDRELAKEYQATNLIAYWDDLDNKAKAEQAKAEQAKAERKHFIRGLKITRNVSKTVGEGILQAYVDAIQKGQITTELFADMQTWAEVAAFMGYQGSMDTARGVAKLTNKVLDEDLIKKAEEAGKIRSP